MVRDMQADYPGCLEELQSMNLSVDELERMCFNMEDELGECVGAAIEYMDIEGSGNFESRSCITALHGAIYGRRGMAESRRRRRGLIRESFQGDVDYYCEQIMEELAMGDEMSYEELSSALGAVMPDFDEAMLGTAIDACLQDKRIQARLGADGLGVFMINPDYAGYGY